MDMLDSLYQVDLIVTIITKTIFILCMFVWIMIKLIGGKTDGK